MLDLTLLIRDVFCE